MRDLFVVLMLVVAVDARRARDDRMSTSASTKKPPASFIPYTESKDDVVVKNPKETHSKLPIDMFMAEYEEEELEFYLKWKATYGDGGNDVKKLSDQAEQFNNWKATNEEVKASFYASQGKAHAVQIVHNKFSCYSEEQKEAMFGVLDKNNADSDDGPPDQGAGFPDVSDSDSKDGPDIPGWGFGDPCDSIFWGDEYLGGIEDQGNCGSNWSFATTATLEGTLARMRELATGLPP
jgi:hypothetical protein